MRILEHFPVTFKGEPSTLDTAIYTIAKDDGSMFDVRIPAEPKLADAFRWMSDNDCLRHLRCVEPDWEDNTKEVHEIETYNANLTEHFHLMNGLKSGYPTKSYAPGSYNNISVPNLQPVPRIEYTCTWTFYSKEHAVMFKLACG